MVEYYDSLRFELVLDIFMDLCSSVFFAMIPDHKIIIIMVPDSGICILID